MAQRGTVEVIDKGGWSRSFPLNKNILHIGSDARNDIVIETWHGAGLAARHLQLVPSPTSGLGYRLVNMGTTEVLLGPNGERSLLPRAAIDLADGDIVRLGELMFVFRSEGAGGARGHCGRASHEWQSGCAGGSRDWRGGRSGRPQRQPDRLEPHPVASPINARSADRWGDHDQESRR